MASLCIPLSKPQLLKHCFFHKLSRISKPLHRFYSSADKPQVEENPDPKSHLSTCGSQAGTIENGKFQFPGEHNPNLDNLEDAEGSGFKHDRKTYYEMIEILCKDRKLEDAKRILLGMSKNGVDYDEDLFVLLINGYAKMNRKWDIVKNCLKVFSKMEELGVPRTIKSYNPMLEAILSEKKYTMAEKFFHKMLSEGVVPTKQTYTLMITGLCRSSRIETANRFFQDMKSQNHLPDSALYNTMINGYVQVKKMEEAEKLLMEMKGQKIDPSLITYNLMINGYAKVRKMEDSEKMFMEMKTQNIQPNLITYNTMINGYTFVEKMEDAQKLVMEMTGRNIDPDLITYITMIKGYVTVNRVDDGLKLLEEIKRKQFGQKVDVLSCLSRLKDDCDAEKLSENQRNVLQDVEDHVERLELLAMRDGIRELSELANHGVGDKNLHIRRI